MKTTVGELFVAESGNPDGPPVLLWPSLFCAGAIFVHQQRALAGTHRVLTLDPPGHGRSGKVPERFTLEETATATFDVMDACGVAEATVVGSAWGGMVGVQMAALAPPRVSGLVLINSPLDRWRGRQLIEMTLLAALLRVGGPRAVARLLTSSMLSRTTRSQRAEIAAPLRASIRSMSRSDLFRSGRAAMLDRPSLLPLLGHLDLPVLVLTGSDDSLVPVERARAEAAAIRGCHFEVISGTAHLSALEAPARVNELLMGFLARTARDVTTTVTDAPTTDPLPRAEG